MAASSLGFFSFFFACFSLQCGFHPRCFFIKQLSGGMAGDTVPASPQLLAPVPTPEQVEGI